MLSVAGVVGRRRKGNRAAVGILNSSTVYKEYGWEGRKLAQQTADVGKWQRWKRYHSQLGIEMGPEMSPAVTDDVMLSNRPMVGMGSVDSERWQY